MGDAAGMRENEPEPERGLVRASKKRKKSRGKPDLERGLDLPGGVIAKKHKSKKQRTDRPVKENVAQLPAERHPYTYKDLFRETTGQFDSTLQNEFYWQFRITTGKDEWVRFFEDSVTIQVFGNYTNPRTDAQRAQARIDQGLAAGAPLPPEWTDAKWTLRAVTQQPAMFLDPSVMGTSFVKSVDVTINGVRVPTNTYNTHLIQYTRCNNIYHANPRPFFATDQDITYPTVANHRVTIKKAMREATRAFDHGPTHNAVHGSRIPVLLSGVFPFNLFNKTLHTVDKTEKPSLYFPPESEIIIRLNLFKDKIEGIWHNGDNCADMTGYFGDGNAERPTGELSLAFQSVLCEYEKVILADDEHKRRMEEYSSGKKAIFQYDVPRSQMQALAANSTYVENSFQIQPKCRLVYILFLPSHAAMVMETRRKPLSAWSRFPLNQTNMQISFGDGNKNLITERFERLGDRDESFQPSKKMLYDYYRERKWLKAGFDELFPGLTNVHSLIQTIVADVSHCMSLRTQNMRIRQEFTQVASPGDQQILVLSVHQTGEGRCTWMGGKQGWSWEFVEG